MPCAQEEPSIHLFMKVPESLQKGFEDPPSLSRSAFTQTLLPKKPDLALKKDERNCPSGAGPDQRTLRGCP